MNGDPAGSERFVIRRVGDTYIANATLDLSLDGEERTISTVLQAVAPGGASQGYELSVSGIAEPFKVTMNVAVPRFISLYESETSRESREFPGGAETRVMEGFVAHHHFFLGSMAPGESAPLISPGERRIGHLTISASTAADFAVGGLSATGSEVRMSGMGGERVVWFDVLGRVLRVEIPQHGYIAERVGLPGGPKFSP